MALCAASVIFVVNAFRLLHRPYLFPTDGAIALMIPEWLYEPVMMFSVDIILLDVALIPLIQMGVIKIRLPRPTWQEILLIVLAVAPYFAYTVYSTLFWGLPPSLLFEKTTPLIVAYLIEMLLVGLIIEEILFRPLLQGLVRRAGLAPGFHLVVGAAFCFSHLEYSADALFIPGWMFLISSIGFAVRGSLLVPVAAHMLNNLGWVIDDVYPHFVP